MSITDIWLMYGKERQREKRIIVPGMCLTLIQSRLCLYLQHDHNNEQANNQQQQKQKQTYKTGSEKGFFVTGQLHLSCLLEWLDIFRFAQCLSVW